MSTKRIGLIWTVISAMVIKAQLRYGQKRRDRRMSARTVLEALMIEPDRRLTVEQIIALLSGTETTTLLESTILPHMWRHGWIGQHRDRVHYGPRVYWVTAVGRAQYANDEIWRKIAAAIAREDECLVS